MKNSRCRYIYSSCIVHLYSAIYLLVQQFVCEEARDVEGVQRGGSHILVDIYFVSN